MDNRSGVLRFWLRTKEEEQRNQDNLDRPVKRKIEAIRMAD